MDSGIVCCGVMGMGKILGMIWWRGCVGWYGRLLNARGLGWRLMISEGCGRVGIGRDWVMDGYCWRMFGRLSNAQGFGWMLMISEGYGWGESAEVGMLLILQLAGMTIAITFDMVCCGWLILEG